MTRYFCGCGKDLFEAFFLEGKLYLRCAACRHLYKVRKGEKMDDIAEVCPECNHTLLLTGGAIEVKYFFCRNCRIVFKIAYKKDGEKIVERSKTKIAQ